MIKKLKSILNEKIKTLNSFDDITRFRLINAFLISLILNLFIPVLTDLKGEYLTSWIISIFLIAETLMIKTNKFMLEKFSIDEIYKMTIIMHILFTISASIYFWSPVIMIYFELILGLFEIAIFSAFNIQLNNHVAENHSKDMNKFQIFRNSIYADSTLIGLSITAILSFFFNNKAIVLAFIIFNSIFIIWLIKNWNFFNHALQTQEINSKK